MKANTVSGQSSGVGVASGRIARRRDVENEEIQMYITKLRDLVPFIPKNKKVSKLEVIHHVIEYICDLQDALSVDMEPEPVTSSPTRTPLGVLAPNTILPPVSCSQEPSNTQTEKSTTPPILRPARPVSC